MTETLTGVSPSNAEDLLELPSLRQATEKQLIAREAASLLGDRETLILDGGRTSSRKPVMTTSSQTSLITGKLDPSIRFTVTRPSWWMPLIEAW